MNRKIDKTGEPAFVRHARGLSRRQFSLATLALAASTGFARRSLADTDPSLIKRFTRDGAGGYGGDSWGDAMPIEWLARSLARAEPGSTYLIGFDADKDDAVAFGGSRVLLQASGSPDQPIVIQAGSIKPGAQAAAGLVAAKRTLFRSLHTWSIATAPKSPQFFLGFTKGASNIKVSGFQIDGTSADGFFKFGGKKGSETVFSNVSFSDIQATNVGRVIETGEGSVLDHFSVTDCTAKGIVRGFARFRAITNSVFRNLDLDADNFDGGGKNVCQVIAIESGENLEFENVTVKNAVNEKDAGLRDRGAGYIQGDGIVAEWKTRNISFRKCHAEGMGDAGFDLKTTDVTMEDCSTEGCKFGVRVWSKSNNVINRGSFRLPRSRGSTSGACIEAVGTVDVHDAKIEAAAPDTEAFHAHRWKEPGLIRVFGGNVTLSNGAKLATGQPGGVVELHDVTVNGKVRNERFQFSDLIRSAG